VPPGTLAGAPRAYPRSVLEHLRDGTRVSVRPIRPSDAALLSAGLAHLSPESARRRFLAPKPRFTLAELRYLTEVDHVDHVALVAVLADAPPIRRLFARISGHLETALEGGVSELTAALAA
jgi:hypothetical protein